MQIHYTLSEVEKVLQRKSWWAMLFILPIARRLSLFFINRTGISPNAITLGSFIFVVGAAIAFSSGSPAGLIIGAVLFEINYLFDCVDGTVARVKQLGTPLGAYLDPVLDRWRIVILSLSLAWGQYAVTGSTTTVWLLFCYLGMNNLILFTRSAQEKALDKLGTESRMGVDLARSSTRSTFLRWWFSKTVDRNVMPYYHDIELDALVFVVGPILNQVTVCLVAANVLALILIVVLNAMFLTSLKDWKGAS
ncbi:MAG: CDP-alcohol phosphatidyltransferase family protein [Desulfobacter sp.]